MYSLHDCFFQGEIVYQITGVYPSQSFFGLDIMSTRADIKVIRDLTLDSLQLGSYEVT